MRTKVLNAFLEKNKVLTSKTDLTKWKFDSYASLGKGLRKLPVLSKKDEKYKLVLLPTEYWNFTGSSDIINDEKYHFLLAGSLNYPIYQEVLKDE